MTSTTPKKKRKKIRFDKFENYSCDGTLHPFFPLAKDFVCVISLHDSSKWKMRKQDEELEIFFYFYYLCYAISTSLPYFPFLSTHRLFLLLFQKKRDKNTAHKASRRKIFLKFIYIFITLHNFLLLFSSRT